MERYGVENVFQLDTIKNKSKKTNMEKYGVEYISQSTEIQKFIKMRNMERYGSEHHLQNKEILEKQIQTNINRYGVSNISKLDSVKIKKMKTCLENTGSKYIFLDESFQKRMITNNIKKYGVDNLLKSIEIRDKIKETNIERYGEDNPSKNENIKNKIKKSVLKTLHEKILNGGENIIRIDSTNRMFRIQCDYCQKEFGISYSLFYKRRETNTCICTICNEIDKHQSGLEVLLQNFISENYNKEMLTNHRIGGKEMDVYLPEDNIAFELNGVYWHSELYKGRNYHKDKTDICLNNNIQLIHIWEDDWIYKNTILKSMILNKIGNASNKIYARKCDIKEITDNYVIKKFLNNNHIQGWVGSTVKIGLYYNKKLVSIMCFKKNKDMYDLNRYCSILNTSIVGGASKLLKYFINNYSNNIVTFSDNSYSNGDLYKKIGFKKEYNIKPDYHYIVLGIREHKFNFRNKDTKNILRIYDSGKIKFRYVS